MEEEDNTIDAWKVSDGKTEAEEDVSRDSEGCWALSVDNANRVAATKPINHCDYPWFAPLMALWRPLELGAPWRMS